MKINGIKIDQCWNGFKGSYKLNRESLLKYKYQTCNIINNFKDITLYNNYNQTGIYFELSEFVFCEDHDNIDNDVVHVVYKANKEALLHLEKRAFSQIGHNDEFVMEKGKHLIDRYEYFSMLSELRDLWYYTKRDKDPEIHNNFSNNEIYQKIISTFIPFEYIFITIQKDAYLDINNQINPTRFDINWYSDCCESPHSALFDLYTEKMESSHYIKIGKPYKKINKMYNLTRIDYTDGNVEGRLCGIQFDKNTATLRKNITHRKNKCSWQTSEEFEVSVDDITPLEKANANDIVMPDPFIELLGYMCKEYKDKNTERYIDLFGFTSIEELNKHDRFELFNIISESP